MLDEVVQDAEAQGGIVTIGGFKNTDEHGKGRFNISKKSLRVPHINTNK